MVDYKRTEGIVFVIIQATSYGKRGACLVVMIVLEVWSCTVIKTVCLCARVYVFFWWRGLYLFRARTGH